MVFRRPVASLLLLMPSLAAVGCGSHTAGLEDKSTEPRAALMTEPRAASKTEPRAAAMTEPGGSGHSGSGEGSGGSGGHDGSGGGSGGGNAHGIAWRVFGEPGSAEAAALETKQHVWTESGELVLQVSDLQPRTAQASGSTHELMRVRVEVAKGKGEMRPSDWYVLPGGGGQALVAGEDGPGFALWPGESFEMAVDFPVSSQVAEVRYSPRFGASTSNVSAAAGQVAVQR